MAATTQQVEAIRLISDWSKWMATIETGMIAVIGTLVRNRTTPPACQLETLAFSASIVCCIISVWFIAAMLASLPAAVQDMEPDQKVWDRRGTWWLKKLPLWRVVLIQFVLFGLAILSFGVGVVGLMAGC